MNFNENIETNFTFATKKMYSIATRDLMENAVYMMDFFLFSRSLPLNGIE